MSGTLLLAEVSVSDLSSAAISVGRPSICCLAGKGTFLSNVFSLSLSLTLFKVYPLEIFNVQDLFLHRVHTLFYVVWLSFLLTKRHLCALLILAEGEECCLL